MAANAGPTDRDARGKGPKEPDTEAPRVVFIDERGIRPTARRGGPDWVFFDPAGWPDRLIAELAAGQRALITRRQLLGLGVETNMIDRALDRGRLHRVHQGVYSMMPLTVLPPLAREHAAILACGERALLSRHSAAAVWGMRPFVEGDVDITVIGSERGRKRKGIHVHRIRSLDQRDARHYNGLPITSPARTLLDIAPHTSARSFEWAIDQALTKRLTTNSQIRAVLATYPRAAGIARLRALTDPDRPTTLTRSHPEEHLFRHLRQAGIRTPEANAKIGNYTADFLWRAEKVILEIDGYHYHHTRTAFERDHQRDSEHQRHDFLVIRVTPRQLERNLEALLVQIAITLERRRPRAA